MSLLALSDASITHLIANVNTNLLKYNKRISKCTQTFPRSLWHAKSCPVLYLFAECGIIDKKGKGVHYGLRYCGHRSGYRGHDGGDICLPCLQIRTGLGAAFEVDEVLSLKKEDGGFRLICNYGEHQAKAVVLASGMKHRKLEAAAEFEGRGVSYCAVCDGMFYKGKTVAVVGGGNTAVTEALYLSDLREGVSCTQAFRLSCRKGGHGQALQ